ncbi:NAD(P)H-binding protein [Pseudonocardia thermophila]|jgi:Predicted nucleoside-diphosphate-sugar epimerases|uniref:NAD(P)H-binding protein n=1 Tax=Pseudonocardia thermophila TaxID=1848 RepID=UPI00248E8996|nr:NAD(P)H-binding protein [Pseudonocardia thermophila]
MSQNVLVIGATGKTGRRVAERLTAAGHRVRPGSRSAAVPFDWADPTTWSAALAGVDACYVAYYPDLAVPGAAQTVAELAAAAGRAGVRRLVLLSGRGEPGAEAAERAVRAVFPVATVVRAAWFNQNFSEGHFLGPVLAGTVALPVGDVREPFVDADDIADVAAAALTDDRHGGELYEVTGPQLLTFGEAVAEIAAATGRAIDFVPLRLPDYLALAPVELSADELWLVEHLFREVLDGRNARLADGVQRALGRPPRDFAAYARATAGTGAWPTGAGQPVEHR